MSRLALGRSLLVPASLFFTLALACSSESDPPASAGTGGSPGAGGRGGSTGSGGASSGTGGSSSGTGGSSSGTGGSSSGTGGSSSGTGGSSSGTGGSSSDGPAPTDSAGSEAAPAGQRFSFFVTSLEAMRRLSKSQNGFGGDLRYGETDGLSGADKICREIAESVMPGSGAKGWKAFLSAVAVAGRPAVNAVDRIGDGPWYDARQRLVAMTKAALLNTRPMGADPAIINDLPNEFGVPNRRPNPAMPAVDNHHFLTGSDTMGRLYGPTATCAGWTTTDRMAGRPRIGFSWPAAGRQHWISGQDEGGCGAGVNVAQTGGSDPSNPIVGSGGGYGGIYCFASQP